MPKFKMIALSNAVENTDLEFNQWYDEHHLKEVSAIPGVTAAKRFKLAAGSNKWSYLAIYDVDANDASSVIAEITKRAGTDEMTVSTSLDRETVYFGVFGSFD